MSLVHAYDAARWGYNRFRNSGIMQRHPASYSRRPMISPYHRPFRKSYKGVDKKFMQNFLKITETKFIDTTISETSVNGTMDIVLINGVGIGDTDILRDGENILITSIQYKLLVTDDSNLQLGQIHKVYLVMKRDVRGAVMVSTALFVTDSITSMRRIENSKNLKILHQKTLRSNPPRIVGDQQVQFITYFHKFKKPIKIKYRTTSETVSGLDRNALFLVFQTDAGATFLPTFQGVCRISFKDV